MRNKAAAVVAGLGWLACVCSGPLVYGGAVGDATHRLVFLVGTVAWFAGGILWSATDAQSPESHK